MPAADRTREGWSVLVQGLAHHLDTPLPEVRPDPWPGGARDLYFRMTPGQVTGRAIRRGR